MTGSQIKKTPPQKNAHLIPLELINGKRFKEIINMVHETSILTTRDRYIYGYALLAMQQNLQALITWWPLVIKGNLKLQNDCVSIAGSVFKDEKLLAMTDQLSDKMQYTLLLVAQQLIPNSSLCDLLKRQLCDRLWQQHDYVQLERILKLAKKALSGVLLENLSKLVFFQFENKGAGNIAAAIGYVLTGGAGLIVRNAMYHHEIANEMQALANELKDLFFKLEIKNKKKFVWDRTLFTNFVDYEASILIRVLQLAVANLQETLDIMPTPSYLITHDAAVGLVGQKFLSWLGAVNQELAEMYNAHTHQAVIWAFGGDRLSSISSILKVVPKNKFHPYLRLALMLRATSIKKGSLSGLVQISDFDNMVESLNLFKHVAIQTAKSMLHEIEHIKLAPEFWCILFEFYQVLQDPEINVVLINRLIRKLHNEQLAEKNLEFSALKNLANHINNHDFVKQLDVLCNRQQECLKLLVRLNDAKQAKNVIKQLTTKQALIEHLTLLADSYFFNAAACSEKFFEHIKTLVKNKAINKLINLADVYYLKCECDLCKQLLYSNIIKELVETLNLAVAVLPKLITCANSQQRIASTKLTILSQPDPFKILGVMLHDPKQLIMQQVMKLSQQEPGFMVMFRKAQSELFNPVSRFLHHYFRYLSYEAKNIAIAADQLSHLKSCSMSNIPFRDEFLNDR